MWSGAGRLPTGEEPQRSFGQSVGETQVCVLQGLCSSLESVPGFKSRVCPLLTICSWAGDCLSQPGFPPLDDGLAGSTQPVGLGP